MRGYAAESAGRFDQAATAFRGALAIDPRDTEALSALADALSESGDRARGRYRAGGSRAVDGYVRRATLFEDAPLTSIMG
jgi:Flp pilus assembly protein TadD